MIINCPCCQARIPLEAALEDAAARELFGVLAGLPAEAVRPLVVYLGLFRGGSRALAWERALRLSREVLALHEDPLMLAKGLSETVRAIRDKQAAGDGRAMRNHNYLTAVLGTLGSDTAPARAVRDGATTAAGDQGQPRAGSRTASALRELEEMKHGR
jgi:hypothetical protein